MSVRLLGEEDVPAWDGYVNGSGRTACYHLSGWREVIAQSFGHRSYYLLSQERDGRITGVCPLVHLRSRLFGSFLVSLPYFNYGGIVAETEEAREELLREAIGTAQALHAGHLELRQSDPLSGSLPVKSHKVAMVLKLKADAGELWDEFPSKLRSQIRRPERDGLSARIGGAEELEAFYEVFSRHMRDLGTPVYPEAFFHNILRRFPEMTRICVVRDRGGQPVASGFLVGFREILEIPWAASLREHQRSSPNMMLYWNVLKFGCERGFAVFDFGRSTRGEGTYRFKEQWGATPQQLYWHYWTREGGPLPELSPRNAKYRAAISLWKRLPVGLTRLLGPAIVRNLP